MNVVPVGWDSDEVAFFVGFQVDLVLQSTEVSEKTKGGYFPADYTATRSHNPDPYPFHVEAQLDDDNVLKPEWRGLPLIETANPSRHSARLDLMFTLQTAQNALGVRRGLWSTEHNLRQLNKLLLDNCLNLVYVISLKGLFFYASATAERLLGDRPDELVGKTLASILHPPDLVTVLR